MTDVSYAVPVIAVVSRIAIPETVSLSWFQFQVSHNTTCCPLQARRPGNCGYCGAQNTTTEQNRKSSNKRTEKREPRLESTSVCAWRCRNGNSGPRLLAVDIEDLRLSVGFHTSPPSENGHATVSHVTVHPRFNDTDRSYDIALVRLSSPLDFGDQLRPVCLPGSSTVAFGNLTRCVVTGLAYTPLSGKPLFQCG